MAEQDRNFEIRDLRHNEESGDHNHYRPAEYREETAAEIAAPPLVYKERYREQREERVESGRGAGYTALAFSILSLFLLPLLFGAIGIVIGFIARRRGAETSGSWAIGIGAISIIIGIFILPFF